MRSLRLLRELPLRASPAWAHSTYAVKRWQVAPRATDEAQRSIEVRSVHRVVEPARRTARMRQRDQERVAEIRAPLRPADGLAERRLPPQPIDRERSDEEDHLWPHERELGLQPWRAERDLRRRRPPIARAANGLAGKAFRDRGAVRESVLGDARAREPAAELGTGATRERRARDDLDAAGRLADDHHAVVDRSRDHRCRFVEVAGGDAPRARADARVQALQLRSVTRIAAC